MVLTDHLVYQQGGSMYVPQGKDTADLISFQAHQEPPGTLLSTKNLFRLALVSTAMLLAILISTAYSLNRAAGAPSARGGWLETKQSPLHHVLLQDQSLSEEFQDTDSGLLQKIYDKATMEVKTLVIAETVVPQENREMLVKYVKQQLESSDVISTELKTAVMTMVNLAPEGSINRQDRGERGSLRNSAVIALIKTYQNNIHFMLIGVRVEPRLGWRWITPSERTAWNDNLSKIRAEVRTFLAVGTPTQLLDVFNKVCIYFYLESIVNNVYTKESP
ncbi:hypothetical protein KC19_7G018000 [Ceratodon purpureus]|uniref:Uncharacterized protein n=1 Tax=Ceratodon purpureus TaxID=3225 RepID=A0A8T0H1U1_CERPU|nr:hypothetical protein KC19_7G018000 [Ceratodon purpureus]